MLTALLCLATAAASFAGGAVSASLRGGQRSAVEPRIAARAARA